MVAPRADISAPPPSASRLRTIHVAALIAILALGFQLRVWGLAAHLPYAVDEPEIMGRVVRMMKTGDFNPHFFDWPSLTIYFHLVIACVAFLAGAMRGECHALAQVRPPDFYLYGRLATSIVGTATIAVLFSAARRWGTATALLAAAMLAVAANHMRESHYVLADVPTAFFTTLTLLLSLRAIERPSVYAYALAGLAAGLAGSCKYNGLVAVVLPLLAACGTGGLAMPMLQRILAVAGSAAFGFLVGTPYAVLDLPKFLNDYARLASVFAQPREGEPGLSLYLKYLGQSLGVPGLALAAIGFALSCTTILRGPSRLRALLLVCFPLLYFKVMATSFQIYGRYTLPLLPFVALLAAIGGKAIADAIGGRVPARYRLPAFAALVLLLVTPPTIRAIGFDRHIAQTSTIDLAYRWIEGHVAPGAAIVSETHPELLISTRYRITNVPPLSGKTFTQYADGGVDYVLVSSVGYDVAFRMPTEHPDAYAAYVTLFKQARELATFAPSAGTPGPGLKLLQISEQAPRPQ